MEDINLIMRRLYQKHAVLEDQTSKDIREVLDYVAQLEFDLDANQHLIEVLKTKLKEKNG